VTDYLLFGPTLHDVVKLLIRQGEFSQADKTATSCLST
jgi:hypothetical protein